MDFEISEELKMLQSLARDFVDKQIRPLERDILGRSADLSDARAYLPEEKEDELTRLVKDMGLWGIGVPEALGGAGLDTLGICLVEEELACTVVPFQFGDITPILFDCNDKHREKYFMPALEGRKRVFLALVELNDNPDPSGWKMTAIKADGHYILNGKKISYSRSGNDYFAVVFALADRGPTCFLVDKDVPGFNVETIGERKGWRSEVGQAFSLTFDDCRVPAENMLGEEGKAFNLGKQWLPKRRIVRGARCLGMARRLLEEAATRAVSVEAFGRPIYERPGVQASLAEMAIDIRAARLMVHEAAWKADCGRLTRPDTAAVKLYATRMLHKIADGVAHIYNGPPYIEGLPMERLCRRVLADSVAEFTLERQRFIIARGVLPGLKV
jgi:acyl-CoA dehydrogenase